MVVEVVDGQLVVKLRVDQGVVQLNNVEQVEQEIHLQQVHHKEIMVEILDLTKWVEVVEQVLEELQDIQVVVVAQTLIEMVKVVVEMV